MVKCKVFIWHDDFDFWNNDVYVIEEFQSVPRIGEWVWTTHEQQKELEKKASMSKDKKYYMFYPPSEDIHFSECVEVKWVLYPAKDPDYVYIVLWEGNLSLDDIKNSLKKIEEKI
jgi:hypothetical protein